MLLRLLLLVLACAASGAQAADYAISGRITEYDGSTPVAGVPVRIFRYEFFNLVVIAQTTSDASGNYSLAGNCSSSCQLDVRSDAHFLEIETLPVDPAGPLLRSFALARPASIAGSVSAAGAPVSLDVMLYAYDPDGGEFYGSDHRFSSGGAYQFDSLRPGRYRVCTEPRDQPLRAQCFDGHDRPALIGAQQYDEVVLGSGEQRSGVDFALNAGGTLSGILRNAYTNTPVSSGRVEIFDASGAEVASFPSAQDGSYRSPGLAAGSYYLRAISAFGVPQVAGSGQLYGGGPCNSGCNVTTGTAIVVGTNQHLNGIDVAIQPRVIARGVVRDAATNQPLAGVPVSMGYLVGTGFPFSATTQTAADGSYALFPSPNLSFRINADAGGDYVAVNWPGHPCPSNCQYSGGTSVVLADGSVSSGYDFALVQGGRIAGALYGPDGLPLIESVYLRLFAAADGQPIWQHPGNDVGSYATPPVPPGTYYLEADSWMGCQVWLGYACPGAGLPATMATPIVVSAGNVTGGVDFLLRADALFGDGFEP